MLEYRINRRKFNKTKSDLPVENIIFTDFEDLPIEDVTENIYNGSKLGKIMATCECTDIDKVANGGIVNCVNKLYLDFSDYNTLNETIISDDTISGSYQDAFTFDNDYDIIGVNKGNKSFSFYFDKYVQLATNRITSGENNEDNIRLYFNGLHYFDHTEQNIVLKFRYTKNDGSITTKDIPFEYFSPDALITSYDNFDSGLYTIIFSSDKQSDSNINKKKYINRFDINDKINESQYQALPDNKKTKYVILNTTRERQLSNVEVYRENFLFGQKAEYFFYYERALADINIPIVNTFETTLYQMELLSEQFVEAEKNKAINRITDLEKDVYYPCISNSQETQFTDVNAIKFNLHFREHRGEDWLVENESFWNGIVLDNNNKATFAKLNNKNLTNDKLSDLLSFLDFGNNDVHYQKNKLKKSFLRLSFFDSMNPGNQNMIGYSTIFLDTGDLFAKYIKYIEDGNYIAVGADRNQYGKYKPSGNKVGIRVDREIFDDTKRLSSQFVVKSKNLSKTSSEGFYIYIWKDNEMAYPQDLYMKVEFNHAGYGRTIPFMMPYWDKQKWSGAKSGIKSFQEILNDWNATKTSVDSQGKVIWSGNTDGHYGIRQYTKFSYIHLKYRYDKTSNKHIYYLDPDTYGSINFPTDEDGNKYIEINLYEAKVE